MEQQIRIRQRCVKEIDKKLSARHRKAAQSLQLKSGAGIGKAIMQYFLVGVQVDRSTSDCLSR
jgi:hypothetical protein